MAEKEVKVKESELKQLLNQNRDLMKRVGELEDKIQVDPSAKEAKAVASRRVTILFVDGKPVVGYANKGTEASPTYVYEAPNPKNPREMVLFVDVILKGLENAPLTLNYNEFLRNSEKKELDVVQTNEKPWSENQGIIEKAEVKEGKYHSETTGAIVAMEVAGKFRSFVVALPDGTTHEFEERYVNISK